MQTDDHRRASAHAGVSDDTLRRDAAAARAEPARRGRPRKLKTDEKIVAAARELLEERGYEAMSFEAIAQRAGVTRPTIYRRWPSKAHLVNDIAIQGPDVPESLVFTDVSASIEAWLKSLMDRYSLPEMKAALAGLASTYQNTPNLRIELQGAIEAKARKDFANMIHAAQASGTVRATIAPDTLFDVVVGTVFYRSIGSSFAGSENYIDEFCEIVLAGILKPEPQRQNEAASKKEAE